MLKLKDGITLEQLEKFGFEIPEEGKFKSYVKWVCNLCSNEYVVVYKGDHEINCYTNGWKCAAQEVLFDLIQAGLVEKIQEKRSMYTLDLTEEELDFIYTRCLRKAMRLEESHLEDVPCYRLANQVMSKIYDCQKASNNTYIINNKEVPL